MIIIKEKYVYETNTKNNSQLAKELSLSSSRDCPFSIIILPSKQEDFSFLAYLGKLDSSLPK